MYITVICFLQLGDTCKMGRTKPQVNTTVYTDAEAIPMLTWVYGLFPGLTY